MPRRWYERGEPPAGDSEDDVRALLQQSPRSLAIVGAHPVAPAKLRLGHARAATASISTCYRPELQPAGRNGWRIL